MVKARAACLVAGLWAAAGCGGDGEDANTATSSVQHSDPSAAIFDETQFNNFSLTMAPADWAAVINDEGTAWRQASLQWRSETIDPIGVRPAGGSRVAGDPKMSLDLRFDAFVPGQLFHGLKRIRLDGNQHDPSCIRDRLSFGIFRAVSVASRAVHCRLVINGEYRGVYGAVEPIDDAMMSLRFGDALGNLYRTQGYQTDPFLWIGPLASNYVPWPWEPMATGGLIDDAPVVRFVDVLNNDPANLKSVCDLESLVAYLAAEAAVTDADGLDGDVGVNNIYQYYRMDDGLFVILPWDLDSTWDNDPGRGIFFNFQNSRLSAIVEDDPVLRARYKAKIGEILDADLAPANVAVRIDFIYDQIRDAVYADPNKAFTNGQFEAQVKFIRDFAVLRAESLRAQIALP